MADHVVLAVSIWASTDEDAFLGSGVLLDRQHVLTAGHLVADSPQAFIGLIDGVAERRCANVLARHPQHDVALLKMEAQTPNEVSPPPLLASHFDLSRQPIVLHVISPLNKSRVALSIYQAASYSDADGEYELSPANARGHSGGVIAWRGLLAGVLFARAKDDPLCRAVSMHRLARWIASQVPGMVLREPESFAPTPVLAGSTAAPGANQPPSGATSPPAMAQSTAPVAQPAVEPWEPEFRARPIATSAWNFDLLLPFARHLVADPTAIDAKLGAVGESNQPEVEVVSGPKGAGKSAWMLLLYEAARRRKVVGRIALMPRFVDLERELDYLFAHGSLVAAKQSLQHAYTKLLDTDRANLFIVDGCARDNPLLPTVLQHLALFLPASRLVIAVDEGFEPRLRELLSEAGLPSPVRTQQLRTLRSDAPQALQFCTDFIVAYRQLYALGAEPREFGDEQLLLDRVRQLRFGTLDTHLLAVVYETLNDESYANFHTQTDFLERYCMEQLRDKATAGKSQRRKALEEDIGLAAQLAFDQFNQRYKPLDPPAGGQDSARHRRVQALVREHQNLRDFLAARHLAMLLQRGAYSDDARTKLSRADLLTIDVPESISAYVKLLINDKDVSDKVQKTIEATHREVASPTAHFMYYVLGRIEGAPNIARAVKFLRDRRAGFLADLAKAGNNEERVEKLAMLRTVFVSLIYLVDPDAMTKYIAHLIEKSQAASVNRGYHRIYYGDATPSVCEGAKRYLDDDPTQAWDRTREALIDRLQKHLGPDGGGNDVSFDLRVFTLISFVLSRRAGDLAPPELDRVCTLLQNCMPELGSDELRHFVRGFLIDVERRSFSPWDFVFDLYRMKSVPRQGWLDRGLAAAAPDAVETVAEHEYFCCLLAWFLLPSPGPGDDYDKRTVVEMLLVHDIAEAYIGDQVTHLMTPDELARYRLAENGAMHYVRARETQSEINGAAVAFDRWSEFDRAGESANARLAKDFDRLENLVQLQLYREQLAPAVYEAFRDGLTARFQTTLVKGLAQSLAAWVAARGPKVGPVGDTVWWRSHFDR